MNEKKTLEERLASHPKLKEQILALLELVEGNPDRSIERADDIEERLIQDGKRLQQQLMQDWAENCERTATELFRESEPTVELNGKKKSTGTQVLE